MNIPRPDQTTFALMLLKDSSDPDVRALSLLDITKAAGEQWTPGNDLCIFIRQPTTEELARMLVTRDA